MSASQPSIEDAATELTKDEKEDVEERVPPRVGVVHETIRLDGEHELHRPLSALAWSGLAAGMSMGFSLMATGVLRASLPDRPWRHLVAQLGYTFGFLVVIIGRQQLFTENSLTPVIPLLHNWNLHTFGRVLRLWAVVLTTNIAGAAIFAFAVARTAIFKPDVKSAFHELGQEALSGSAGEHLLRAIVAGWLIAILIWMLTNADGNRLGIIMLITWLIGAAHLSHVIAGSIDVLYVVADGSATLRAYVMQFFLPTLAGNMLGGIALVAAIGHAQTISDAKE